MNNTFSSRVRYVLYELSGFLILGALAGMLWANIDQESYHAFVEFSLADSHGEESSKHHYNLHFLVNGFFMAFFFALAGKEVWEALLPGGSLSGFKKAAMPLMATVGGMAGPALLFLLGAHLTDSMHLSNGWAVPCATDIAFSYLAARVVFGKMHPAIPFLLLIAIADDADGLIILATCYPSAHMNMWAFIVLVGLAVGMAMLFRRQKVLRWQYYMIGPGLISWVGFALGGIEPALGFVPVIPFLPHAKSDIGVFAREELDRKDTLSQLEHDTFPYVQVILGLFGLVNAGVVFDNAGTATVLITTSLLIGKPLGILGMSLLGYAIGLRLPEGLTFRHVLVLGISAGIGFTVALFVATVAYVPGIGGVTQAELDAAKMGALLSIFAFGFTIIAGRLLRVQKITEEETTIS